MGVGKEGQWLFKGVERNTKGCHFAWKFGTFMNILSVLAKYAKIPLNPGSLTVVLAQ